MRKKAILVAVLGAMTFLVNAQNKSTWGVSGGLIFPMDGFSFDQSKENINSIFSSESNTNGWFVGLFGRAYAGNSLYFYGDANYLNTHYYLHHTSEGKTFSENMHYSGAQLGAGMGIEAFNFLRVQAGVNGLAYLDNNWNDSFDTFGTGYTIGAGIDLWRITLDVKYNGAFNSNTGEWNGAPLSYRRSDLMVGIGIKF